VFIEGALMKFGYFDDSRKEYVITTAQTPYPWTNYLGNREFFSLISNTQVDTAFSGMLFQKGSFNTGITVFRLITEEDISLSERKMISGLPDGSRLSVV
jgi:hypothetical protein